MQLFNWFILQYANLDKLPRSYEKHRPDDRVNWIRRCFVALLHYKRNVSSSSIFARTDADPS